MVPFGISTELPESEPRISPREMLYVRHRRTKVYRRIKPHVWVQIPVGNIRTTIVVPFGIWTELPESESRISPREMLYVR